MDSKVSKILSVAETVASLQPQIEVLLKLVRAGFVGYGMVRAFLQSEGHDNETLDAIIAEMQAEQTRWETAKF